MSFYDTIMNFFSCDMAIDLGTANTLIYIKGRGIVLNEPSVVATQTIKNVKKVIAVGHEAKLMLGKTADNICAARPMMDGVIADFEIAEQMISHFIKKVTKHPYMKKSLIVICVPSGSTPVERRAIQDSAYNAGGSKVYLIEEPVAAALGANLPIMDPVGSMVVDIGGGTTEVAVLSLGGVVCSESARIGGDKMDMSIVEYVKSKHHIQIGIATAQKIKETIGCALIMNDGNPELNVVIKGIDFATGLPKEIELTQADVQVALSSCVSQILDLCKKVLASTPPELVSDIVEKGIVITGGGSLLKHLDKAVSNATKVPVIMAPRPLESVVIGTGIALENINIFRNNLMYY